MINTSYDLSLNIDMMPVHTIYTKDQSNKIKQHMETNLQKFKEEFEDE